MPFKDYAEQFWPHDLLDMPSLEAFDDVWIEPLDIQTPPLTVKTAFLFRTELAVGIPGLDAVSLVVAPHGSNTAFAVEFTEMPVPEFRLLDLSAALRLDSSLFKPARRRSGSAGGSASGFEVDPVTRSVDLTLARTTLSIDSDGNLAFDGGVRGTLPPCFLADTGLVIEAAEVGIFLDANQAPPGRPRGWRGIHIAKAGLYLPGEMAEILGSLEVRNCYIGNGGFSGSAANLFAPSKPTRLFGLKLTLQQVEVTFVQNALTRARIAGTLTIPFFDTPIDVEIHHRSMVT
ncbi:MAG: hypothetical protein WKF37_17185 [Bryobacteraceae bacterium]